MCREQCGWRLSILMWCDDFLFSELPIFYESDNEREDQPGWSDDKTEKNDEEEMFTTDPVSKDPVLHAVETNPSNDDVECFTCSFLSFPVITKAEHADACYDVWGSNVSNEGKEQNSNCVDEGREVCIIDPALQGTQYETKESIKDILHGLLNNMKTSLNEHQGEAHTERC